MWDRELPAYELLDWGVEKGASNISLSQYCT